MHIVSRRDVKVGNFHLLVRPALLRKQASTGGTPVLTPIP